MGRECCFTNILLSSHIVLLAIFFFFSSRRRHTRLQGDWSSDVCSSDLELGGSRRAAQHRVAQKLEQSFLLIAVRRVVFAVCEALRLSGRRMDGERESCRSEEHTSELQSPCNLVCRLLLEKKNTVNA